MSGFIFNGMSTENIVSSPLVLCTFDSANTVIGVERDNVRSEPVMSSFRVNDYGSIYQPLSFEYSLIKANGTAFTTEEQVTVERWLTSPNLSVDLTTIDCEGNAVATYVGKFVSTEWETDAFGFVGVNFKFDSIYPYPIKRYRYEYEVRGYQTIEIPGNTDALNHYIYPVITITEPFQTAPVVITNVTDGNNALRLNAYDRLPITVDCENCIVKDVTSSTVVSFEDLGWKDVGNIYWLRLLPGTNELLVEGDADIVIEYTSIYKKVGGWL